MVEPIDTSTLGAIRVVPGPIPILPALSFAQGVAGGVGLHDRWKAMWDAGVAGSPPPMDRGDAGWVDLFRTAYELVRWQGNPPAEPVHHLGTNWPG